MLATIEDPQIIRQILTHLGFPTEEVRPDPAQPPSDLFAGAFA